MAVDWSYAALVSVVGFGSVFAILIILLFFIWLTGKIILKLNANKEQTSRENS